MSFFNGLISYICIWWVIFFMALPIGVKRDQNPELGNDPGAPQKTYLWHKLIITSLLSAILLWALNFYMELIKSV